MTRKTLTLFDPALVRPALLEAFKKLDPRVQWHNPVMFVVYVGSGFTTALAASKPEGFTAAVALWLWFTVLFANFAEAMAEGRSKAQAASLRGLKKQTWAKKLDGQFDRNTPRTEMTWLPLEAAHLRKGDVVLVEAGDTIPADGEVIDGVASVDESAITGESAPVIREPGGDFSAVTGGTRVLSDWIVVRVAVNPGETFVDRMIAMVENAKRHKTPNEIALTILLVALTAVFLGVVVTLLPFSLFSVQASGAGEPASRRAGEPGGAGGPAGVPDPHHDCRPAQRHWRGGHEPHDAGQCDRHLRPRGGGCGRCGRAAAGQDRHHHPGQPPGQPVRVCARGDRCRIGRCRPARIAGRRNPRRPQHRGAGQAEVQPARA